VTRKRRTVKFLVSEQLLRMMFRLPNDVRIVGALVDANGLVTFSVDAPHAPANVVAMLPVYRRDGEHPDPVSLVEIRWQHADGTETVQPAIEETS
jgi:hypothetical protein